MEVCGDKMDIQEPTSIYSVREVDNAALDLEILYENWNGMLCSYAFDYLSDMEAAKTVVNDAFVQLWKMENKPTHLKAYLYRAVKNACLNAISKRKLSIVYTDYAELELLSSHQEHSEPAEDEQERLLFLEMVIEKLPFKRKMVFKMFRFEELSYAEIAELLNISVRTVEDHLAKSMQFIHAQAKHLIHEKLTNA